MKFKQWKPTIHKLFKPCKLLEASELSKLLRPTESCELHQAFEKCELPEPHNYLAIKTIWTTPIIWTEWTMWTIWTAQTTWTVAETIWINAKWLLSECELIFICNF